MGRVYLALDRRLEGRRCAIKEVLPLHPVSAADSLAVPRHPADFAEGGAEDLAADAIRAQFRHEAQVLAQLDHPNLPKVSDYFSVAGRDYLVMDFVAGQDLRAIVTDARQRGRFLPENQVLMWADQLCDALTYLHNQEPPVVHRDVKPANIKLTPAGQIKLVDFGLVTSLSPENLETVTVVRGAGSLAYMPLEQFSADSRHIDVRSDVYSLGATLYRLLTGQAPPTAQGHFLRPSSLIPPSEINPAISAHVEAAILQAMSPHPEGRPASVEEFRRMLFTGPASAAHDTEAMDRVEGAPLTTGEGLPAGWDWRAIVRANIPWIVLALAMLVWAVFVTFR
ncbi:MAG: serine/threonine-protein kinase [Anaerolineae bacterium]